MTCDLEHSPLLNTLPQRPRFMKLMALAKVARYSDAPISYIDQSTVTLNVILRIPYFHKL